MRLIESGIVPRRYLTVIFDDRLFLFLINGGEMGFFRRFLKSRLLTQKEFLLQEGRRMNGFMKLIMKEKNTGVKLTPQEKSDLKGHLRHMAGYVPVLVIFALPFGFLMLPILAEVFERRRGFRNGNRVKPADRVTEA